MATNVIDIYNAIVTTEEPQFPWANPQVIVKGVTQKGKNRIREHGLVIETGRWAS